MPFDQFRARRSTNCGNRLSKALYIELTYNFTMDAKAKTERWSIRVSSNDNMIVRRMAAHNRMSLNEYVVSNAVTAAISDLSDRRLFVLSAKDWQALQEVLDRPVSPKPRLTELMSRPSVLEVG